MSGSIRANWHIAALRVPEGEDDPFDMTEGTVIDLTQSVATLNDRLVKLCRAESRMYEWGIRCDLKQGQDMSCHACPQFTADENDPLASLCHVGREQEDLIAQLKSVHTIESEFEEMVERTGVAEALELAEALV